MAERSSRRTSNSSKRRSNNIFDQLPPTAKEWAESLPWKERSYVLSLCHLMCAASPEVQAEFLDDYTADGLVLKTLEDRDTQQQVKRYLTEFCIETELNESVLRSYIKQFYIHSSQDVRRKPELYLESALRLVSNIEERNNVFNYILGFELLKMMFQMSWIQHERLYQMQRNQEYFFNTYIKPIQHTHELNGIVAPKNKKKFFEKRDYFIQQPKINNKKLMELIMATFTTDVVTNLGFSVIRNISYLVFDYEYIFNAEQEVFPI